MTDTGSRLDAARARVVERGLTPVAVEQLTPVVADLPIESLGPVKQLLKRFFSDGPWTDDDDAALAEIVSSDVGVHRHELEPGLTLTWGTESGRFRLWVESDAGDDESSRPRADTAAARGADVASTFESEVVPEATPSPRTIRFATPPIHGGASRSYESAAAAAEDPRVARIFADFGAVTNVLVGPDFVAVTIDRPGRWEVELAPMLGTVADEFAGDDDAVPPGPEPPMVVTLSSVSEPSPEREHRTLERAWAELGGLRADRPEHLDRILEAAHDDEAPRRQVAAALLDDAPSEVAARTWRQLLDDRSRSVRRSVVDAVAGKRRDELRPLLEHALRDRDAWTRWKAVRGLADLGIRSSRAVLEQLATDSDFRVRLEIDRALAPGDGPG